MEGGDVQLPGAGEGLGLQILTYTLHIQPFENPTFHMQGEHSYRSTAPSPRQPEKYVTPTGKRIDEMRIFIIRILFARSL